MFDCICAVLRGSVLYISVADCQLLSVEINDDDDDYYYFYSRNSHLSTLAIARFTTLLHITSGVRSFVLG